MIMFQIHKFFWCESVIMTVGRALFAVHFFLTNESYKYWFILDKYFHSELRFPIISSIVFLNCFFSSWDAVLINLFLDTLALKFHLCNSLYTWTSWYLTPVFLWIILRTSLALYSDGFWANSLLISNNF